MPHPAPPSRRLPLAALTLAALLTAACSPTPDADPTPTPAPTSTAATTPADQPTGQPTGQPTDVAAMAFTGCETDRYTVGHPATWNVNDHTGVLEPCTIFHPDAIDEPDQPRDRDLHHAVTMYVDQVDYDDIDPDDNPNDVLEYQTTTVDGRRAQAVEYRSTGQALTPEGERSYTWTVDLDGQTLIATTSSVGDTSYDHDKQVLDRMIADTLTVHSRPATTETADGQ